MTKIRKHIHTSLANKAKIEITLMNSEENQEEEFPKDLNII